MIRHGATVAVRAASFAVDEGLEAGSVTRARGIASSLPGRCVAVSGPERACRETAAALGLAAEVVPRLAACDVGAWKGRSLEEIAVSDPAGLAAWMSDPDAAPHGGERLSVFSRRAAAWLEAMAVDGEGFVVAIVDAGVVKAAVVHALEAPLNAFWRVDVAPLTVTELHGHAGRWTLSRANAPLARSEGFGYRPDARSRGSR